MGKKYSMGLKICEICLSTEYSSQILFKIQYTWEIRYFDCLKYFSETLHISTLCKSIHNILLNKGLAMLKIARLLCVGSPWFKHIRLVKFRPLKLRFGSKNTKAHKVMVTILFNSENNTLIFKVSVLRLGGVLVWEKDWF